MDVNELKAHAAVGKLSVERLLDVIVALQHRFAEYPAHRGSIVRCGAAANLG